MIQTNVDHLVPEQQQLNDDRIFELGKLHYERGDFDNAIFYLNQASEAYFLTRMFSQYLSCQNILLRIYAEREDFEKINITKEKLQDLVLKEGFELNSKTYYTLATCTSYKGQNDTALEYAQKALSLALAVDDKEDICKSIFLIALSNFYSKKYTEALKEIYNLHVFFQVYDFPDIKASTRILNISIHRRLGKLDEALSLAWEAYEELKHLRSITMNVHLLGLIGMIYNEIGDKENARSYLKMALKMVDQKNQVRVANMLKSDLLEVGGEQTMGFDISLNETSHIICEKKLGTIDFKNQFILLDLLKLLMINQGIVYSKEQLVDLVWKQTYDPAVHDNKIYVTIKRLRKLIEPDYDKPKYLFRAKNGYYFNKSVKVKIEK